VDVLGFLTGTVLYVMLVVMVWRERMGDGKPFLARRRRLPLLTGLAGVVWNAGALLFFGTRIIGGTAPDPTIVAIAFSALGCLPAFVVHSLLEGRETLAGRGVTRVVIATAYGLSIVAAVMHVSAAIDGLAVPSRAALWVLTVGFTALTATLLLMTRRQPIGRRGVWVAALAIFAVSAFHFGRHGAEESWWVELIGHHASLPLALAILHQDYRFALADLFLKNAIAVLLLMAVSLALFSGVIVPLLRWQDPAGVWDPRAIALFVAMWMTTALLFPLLRTLADRVVDRVVLKRPDYAAVLRRLAADLDAADSEDVVIHRVSEALTASLGVPDPALVADVLPRDDRRVVATGADVRGLLPGVAPAVLLRLPTAEQPRRALALGPLTAGRRLLSDDVHLLEAIAQQAARRIDSLRVAQERLEGNLREQRMQRLATEAELRALRAQLNPHFLFNALTTIGYLIQTAPARAVDTLLRLTHVLRGVLRRSTSEFSTLGEEIDLVRSYLEIERARFEERLLVTIDVPADVGQLVVPTLLIQPIVENAVKHGLAPTRAGGALRVSAWTDAATLHVRVEDSGAGFDPASRGARAGVGLTSVAQRLASHYGTDAGVDIQSAPGRGTTVQINLPVWPESQRTVDLAARRTG
jgi:two-component system LytT family sensor kinase